MRHIIDLCDLTEKEFSDLYKLTTNIIDRPEGYADACRGKVLGSLFYEPSTRTNLSFSTAMMRLGGSVVGFSDPGSSSTAKGETLKDTINMVSSYADLIVMRNPVSYTHLDVYKRQAQYHGAQVFYSPGHADSKTLAELLQASLAEGCDPANTRQAKQAERTIYLMKQLECPAVIVECGFLSNPAEEQRLNDTAYHKKLAASIVTGYLRYESGG